MMIDSVYFSGQLQNKPSKKNEELGEVCIANISPLERKKRLAYGIRQFIFTLVILGVMIALHLNPLWRLLLQFMFAVASVSYFQARDKT